MNTSTHSNHVLTLERKLELTAEMDDIDEIISRIEPMVEDLIERHTRQLALPIEN